MSEFDPTTYWETRLSNHRGLTGVGYTKLGESYNRWLYRIRSWIFLRTMRELAIDFVDLEVLDLGSGTGFYVDLWSALGVKRVVGTDLTRVAIEEMARQRPGIDFLQLDITADSAKSGAQTFDIVSAFDMLFHIVDDEMYKKAIQNVHSLLKPGGLFVLSENFLHREAVRDVYMVSRSLDFISKVLRDSGFEIVLRRPVFVLMNNPIDSKYRAVRQIWRAVTRAVCLSEVTGFLWGALLYPIERVCVAYAEESPATEMMICRRLD